LRAGLIGAMCLVGVAFLFTAAPAAAQAQEAAGAPPGTLVKFVILSRHGVRSPTLDPKELDTWTESKWPSWACATGACARGELTPRGQELAMQMGTYYRRYLSSLLPETPDTPCPGAQDLFVWPDVSDERTRDTALGLLQGFRPACDPGRYIRTQTPSDPIFHSIVQSNCRLDATRAEQEINGNLSKVVDSLRNELALAQEKLQCCKPELCQKVWRETCARTELPPPNTCTLQNLPTCVVRSPKSGPATKIELGGALRIASSFAEILLLEYANGFQGAEYGWGRITRPEELTALFRLHTEAFGLEQRTSTIAAAQGSMLLRRILLALKDEDSNASGAVPQGTKFAAYVGHDTNIANLGGLLELNWDPPSGQQPAYQRNQTPPAGALTFELRELGGVRKLYVAYVAQSLADMRADTADRAIRTPVSVPQCSTNELGFPCPLATFESLVTRKLDQNCAQ
jgi:4-phytase/acid phosphatase